MKMTGKRVNSPVNVDTKNVNSHCSGDGTREVIKIKGGKIFNLNGEKLENELESWIY